MKKIICLIESLTSGGAERQMVYLASELKNAKFDVEVWTYYPDDFYLPILRENHVPYNYIRQATDKIKRIPVLRKMLNATRPNVVISYLDTANILACIIKAFGGRFKLIVSERNTTQALSLKQRLKFYCYKFADYIVPNSYTQGEFIKHHYPNLSSKIRVITNFVDTGEFVPQSVETRNENLSIIVVGRIHSQKNPLKFMDAIKIVQKKGIDAKVTWYGKSYDERYQLLCVDKIKELGLEESFIFVLPTQNIAEEYPKYDLFCLPSIYEGFPNVLCEAMSCGLPVACSNVCDNPNIVINEENGYLFNPNNPQDIACQIEKFARLPREQRSKIGANNRKRIESIFSGDEFIKKYINLI